MLQLGLCLWTSKGAWPEKVETLRAELCVHGAASFTSAKVAENATKCVEVFQKMHLDEERPAKRRKISHDLSEDVNTSAYHKITMLLNGSSQDSPILNLSRLRDIVQYVLHSVSLSLCLHCQGEVFLSA